MMGGDHHPDARDHATTRPRDAETGDRRNPEPDAPSNLTPSPPDNIGYLDDPISPETDPGYRYSPDTLRIDSGPMAWIPDLSRLFTISSEKVLYSRVILDDTLTSPKISKHSTLED